MNKKPASPGKIRSHAESEKGGRKASELLRALKGRVRKEVSLVDFYRSHNPPSSMEEIGRQVNATITMRDYQIKEPETYRTAQPRAAKPLPVTEAISQEAERLTREAVRRMITPQDVAEALRAWANDRRSTDSELAQWADCIAWEISPQ